MRGYEMVDTRIHSIFKKGSKTYFYSTHFFPKHVKEDVSVLYGFVRKADDFVDTVPQQVSGFMDFKARYARALSGKVTGDVVIDSFVDLMRRKAFDKSWVKAFLRSMEDDITISSYDTLKALERYLYGSSEVVGLMMAKVMDLPEESYAAARHLGKAMQYINFIRDIQEDLGLGRSYLPREELSKFGLESLTQEEVSAKPRAFREFVKAQVDIYFSWLEPAEEGFQYIPRQYLIPIKTASDMYKWTARKIARDPFIIYQRKVKPSIERIVYTAMRTALSTRSHPGLPGPIPAPHVTAMQ
jgi:phytoene synthase